MDMDPITLFLQASNPLGGRPKRLNLSAFINVHARLSLLQMNRGHVTFEDLLQSLNLTFGSSSEVISTQDMHAYAGIIYEACFQPIMLNKGPSFMLDRSLVGNESVFLKLVLQVLFRHNGGKEHNVIEDLKNDMIAFLQRSGASTEAVNALITAGEKDNTDASRQPQRIGTNSSSLESSSPVLSSVNGAQQRGNKSNPSALEDPYSEDARAILNAGMEFEKNEPIVRLLAHIRKAGMDILFPQIIHDKILMCIFVSMKCAHSLAHRELIDVVMAIKDARAVTQLDNVSRTKVRGVLALLKHAQMFITHGEEGEAVRLHLTPAIATFKDLRDKHDAFVNRCILQHHLFIPVNLKSELVWQLDNEVKELRLQELKGLEAKIDAFLTSGPGVEVLEPFLAIARTVHIPTTLPPSMMNNNLVGVVGGGSNDVTSHQPSVSGSPSLQATTIYSTAPRAVSMNLPNPARSLPAGNNNYSIVTPPTPPPSFANTTSSNLNYLNNPRPFVGKEAAHNYYGGAGGAGRVTDSYSSQGVQDRTFVQNRPFLVVEPGLYGPSATNLGNQSFPSNNKASNNWYGPSHSSYGVNRSEANAFREREIHQPLPMIASDNLDPYSSRGPIGSTYSQYSEPRQVQERSAIGHNFDTYNRTSPNSSYGHPSNAVSSGLSTDNVFFFQDPRGSRNFKKEETFEGDLSSSSLLTASSLGVPGAPSMSNYPLTVQTNIDPNESHDHKLLDQLRQATIDDIVGERVVPSPASKVLNSPSMDKKIISVSADLAVSVYRNEKEEGREEKESKQVEEMSD